MDNREPVERTTVVHTGGSGAGAVAVAVIVLLAVAGLFFFGAFGNVGGQASVDAPDINIEKPDVDVSLPKAPDVDVEAPAAN